MDFSFSLNHLPELWEAGFPAPPPSAVCHREQLVHCFDFSSGPSQTVTEGNGPGGVVALLRHLH